MKRYKSIEVKNYGAISFLLSLFLFLLFFNKLGGQYVEQKTNLSHLLQEKVALKARLGQIKDIRYKPSIKLAECILSIFLMPFNGLTSLLALDRVVRERAFKKLFGCKRKMIVSDSTLARILFWLDPKQMDDFLLSFKIYFEEEDLLAKKIIEKGKRKRLGIIDGSHMGKHMVSVLNLCGKIDFPVIVQKIKKQGKELEAFDSLFDKAQKHLKTSFPELFLLDGLYFNKKVFDRIRKSGAHLLIKSLNPFREVLKDAQEVFKVEDKQIELRDYSQDHGFDSQRMCSWQAKLKTGDFAGYPVLVVHLVEHYPKKKSNNDVNSWICTTDCSLSIPEIREAAHLRWHIENNVFKRLAKHTGTKRFYFKKSICFLNMLKIFLAAIAVFDALIYILSQDECAFKQFLDGIKPTWANIFSRFKENFPPGLFALG